MPRVKHIPRSDTKYISYQDLRPYATERSNKSGKYFRPLLQGIVKASQQEGVNPYEMLGLALQETNFGQTLPHQGRSGDVFNIQTGNKSNLNYAAKFLKEKERNANSFFQGKFGRPATRAEVLQFWEGRGYTPSGKLGWRDIPTGKVIMDHIESLKKNPGITKLLMRR